MICAINNILQAVDANVFVLLVNAIVRACADCDVIALETLVFKVFLNCDPNRRAASPDPYNKIRAEAACVNLFC